MFRSPSDLAKLAQMKAEGNGGSSSSPSQQSQPTSSNGPGGPTQWQSSRDHMLRQEAAGKATPAMNEWLQNWRDKGAPDTQSGMQSPVAPVEPSPPGGELQESSILNDPNKSYEHLVAVCNLPPQQAAATVMSGPAAVEEAVLTFGGGGGGGAPVDNRGNAGAFGLEHDVNSNRDNPYGVTSISDTSSGLGFSGNPEHFITSGNPADMQGVEVGYNGQPPAGQQQQAAGPSGGNPMAMANALMGVTSAARTNPAAQYHQQQQMQAPQQAQQPAWSPVQNSASAGAPPGHGGSNPGYSGMLTNTDATMAALKALMERNRGG